MPGFDRRGPTGMGQMTGWGRGFCGQRGSHGGGRRSWGYGRSSSRNRGRDWRQRYWATGMPEGGRMYPPPRRGYYEPDESDYGPSHSHEDELTMLKEQATALENELKVIDQRISVLAAQRKFEE